jgi:hypothetical protein
MLRKKIVETEGVSVFDILQITYEYHLFEIIWLTESISRYMFFLQIYLSPILQFLPAPNFWRSREAMYY